MKFETSILIKNLIEKFVKFNEDKANKKVSHKELAPHVEMASSSHEGKEEENEKISLTEQTREKRLLYYNNKARLFQQQQLPGDSAEKENKEETFSLAKNS